MFVKISKGKFSTRAKILKYPFGVIKGLMFSPKLKKGNSVLLKFKRKGNYAIHMLFVFQKIDAVWINNNKIVYIRRSINPFSLKTYKGKPATAILETSEEETKNLKIGNKLSFINNL